MASGRGLSGSGRGLSGNGKAGRGAGSRKVGLVRGAVRVGVPRVRGGSRWVFDCWSKGSDQFLHEPMATLALRRTLKVGNDQEVGRNESAK